MKVLHSLKFGIITAHKVNNKKKRKSVVPRIRPTDDAGRYQNLQKAI